MGKIVLLDKVYEDIPREKLIELDITEEYDRLTEEANKRIKENRVREAQALLNARNCIALY